MSSEGESGQGNKASEFHLSWNNYEASLAGFLRILSSAKAGEDALYDVTISCAGGKVFQVSVLCDKTGPTQGLDHLPNFVIDLRWRGY